MINQLVVFFTIVVFFAIVLKPVEAVMSSLGFAPDSSASWTVQSIVVIIIFITYAWLKNKSEGKNYEREIEKKLRAEREIRERLDREYQVKSKK